MSADTTGSPQEIVHAEDMRDPEFRAHWERTALARELSLAVVRYRAEHGLSQRALAAKLGVHQPQISRLEDGETTPSLDTLANVARGLGLHVRLEVSASGTIAAQVA